MLKEPGGLIGDPTLQGEQYSCYSPVSALPCSELLLTEPSLREQTLSFHLSC